MAGRMEGKVAFITGAARGQGRSHAVRLACPNRGGRSWWAAYQLFRPDLDVPTMEDAQPAFESLNPMKKAFIEPIHVSNLVLFLASDESAYISGGQIPVDAGAAIV